jgi:hypothetical protein
MPDAGDFDAAGTLVVEQHFAIVPEWVIDAGISDAAFRLYSVLLRYGQSSGARMPSRATLARRLRKRSVDSVDRAMKELVAVGAVAVELRRRGRENLTNRYHLMSVPPSVRAGGAVGGRTDAATPQGRGSGRRNAATPGRTDAARVAAPVRPDPGVPTQENPPPPAPPRARPTPRSPVEAEEGLARSLDVDDLDHVAADYRAARRRLGQPTGLWTTRSVIAMLAAAVHEHGWPADAAVPAILARHRPGHPQPRAADVPRPMMGGRGACRVVDIARRGCGGAGVGGLPGGGPWRSGRGPTSCSGRADR